MDLGVPVPLLMGILLAASVWFVRLITTRSKWVGKLTLAGLVLLVCAASAEVLFRTVLVRRILPACEEDFDRSIASTWPQPVPVERRPGMLRILGLSDSFGKAGKQDNFHYLLERRLRKEGVKAEVINLSLTGLSPRDELKLLEREGLRYKPDIVLHSIFVGNDLNPCPGTLVNCAGIIFRIREGLAAFRPRNLVFVTWIRSWFILHNEIRRENEEKERREYYGALSRIGFMNSLEKESEVYRIDSTMIDWDDKYATLDSIREAVTRAGAIYLPVIHPSPVQYDESLWSDFISHFDLDPKDFDLKQPQTRLQWFFLSRGVPCLDLLPVFEAQRVKTKLYQKRDIHYRSLGNRVAAEAIHDFLEGEGLIEVEPKHRLN